MRTTMAMLLLASIGAAADEAPRPLVALSGATSQIEVAEIRRLVTSAEFKALWLRHVGAQQNDDYYNPAGVPEIDFDRCMVVAIFQGKAWNSAGVRIDSLSEDAERLLLRFDDKSYQTEGPDGGGERCSAFGIFVLPRSTKQLVVEENVQGLIGAPPEWKERERFAALSVIRRRAPSGDREIEVMQRVADALPPGERTASQFLKALEPYDTSEDREIGFGARRLSLVLGGATVTYSITLIVHGETLGPLQVEISGASDAVLDTIAKVWESLSPTRTPRGYFYHCGNLYLPQAFAKERGRLLGDPLTLEAHPDIEADYLLLWSPLSDLIYGYSFGEGGDPAPGREALERILTHPRGRPPLLDLLRGPNPEGRIYALEGLERMRTAGQELDESTLRIMKTVRELDVKIRWCDGCFLFGGTAQEALAALDPAAR